MGLSHGHPKLQEMFVSTPPAAKDNQALSGCGSRLRLRRTIPQLGLNPAIEDRGSLMAAHRNGPVLDQVHPDNSYFQFPYMTSS
jgi:hypothetical protein